MKEIRTTDRDEFLKDEKKYYPWRKYEEFVKNMEDILKRCITCNIYYWSGCQKRCKCDSKL